MRAGCAAADSTACCRCPAPRNSSGASGAWAVPGGIAWLSVQPVAPPPEAQRVLLPSPTLCPWRPSRCGAARPPPGHPPGAQAPAPLTGALSCCVTSTEAGRGRSPLTPGLPSQAVPDHTQDPLSGSPSHRPGWQAHTLPGHSPRDPDVVTCPRGRRGSRVGLASPAQTQQDSYRPRHVPCIPVPSPCGQVVLGGSAKSLQ